MSQVQSADCQVFTNVSLGANVETVVAVSVPATVESDSVKVSIKFSCVLNPASGTTFVNLRIYRGINGLGTFVIQTGNIGGTFNNGQNMLFSIVGTDQLTRAAFAQYCVTIQTTAAGASATLPYCAIETIVLSG